MLLIVAALSSLETIADESALAGLRLFHTPEARALLDARIVSGTSPSAPLGSAGQAEASGEVAGGASSIAVARRLAEEPAAGMQPGEAHAVAGLPAGSAIVRSANGVSRIVDGIPLR